MMMVGRKFSASGSYRFGFNGKENDDEVKSIEGCQQDYGFRIYDPRLGIFLSVDPLSYDYPWYTPYQFAGNMPIKCIDLDGLEPAEPGENKGDKQINKQGEIYEWNGEEWSQPKMEEVVIRAVRFKKIPKGEEKAPNTLPYAEITKILLDKNRTSYEKLKELSKPGIFPINPAERRKLDGALLKNIVSGALLEVLDKGFTALDIVNLGMSIGANGDAPLELPVVGGLVNMIVSPMVDEMDEWLLENALSKGYIHFARVLNSSAGRRSGIEGIYVTRDVMLSILQAGGLNLKIHNYTGHGSRYVDNPNNHSDPKQSKLEYFIFFPSKGDSDIITSFGVLPIN